MSVRLEDGIILLEGRCRIEEAETLLAHLVEDGDRPVDLSRCDALHSAIVQILLAAKPGIVGHPTDPFLSTYVMPQLATDRSPSGASSL